jgi:hypothetical protein
MSSLASAFGRPRTELRHRLLSWARSVVARLADVGVDVDPCALDEADAQRVALVPSGTPVDEPSARLAIAMNAAQVEVALELPPRELLLVRARLGDPERSLELSTALEALPEQFTMGTSGDEHRAPASRASTDEIRALLDRIEREQRSLWLGWSVPRVVAVAHAASLDEQLEDAMVALGQVLALVASPPEGATAGAHPLRRDRRDRPRRDEERDGKSAAASPRGAHHGDGKRRARGRDREREPEGELEPEPEAAPERDAAPRLLRSNAKPLLRAGSRRRPLPTRAGGRLPVEKGARVRVLEGPFSGKVGVVQELDGKGGARVMLGLLAVRIEVKDLVDCAEGRDRLRLSSSHRKPLPVRS